MITIVLPKPEDGWWIGRQVYTYMYFRMPISIASMSESI